MCVTCTKYAQARNHVLLRRRISHTHTPGHRLDGFSSVLTATRTLVFTWGNGERVTAGPPRKDEREIVCQTKYEIL